MKQIGLIVAVSCSIGIFSLAGCSKGVTHDGAPATNTSGQNAVVTTTPSGQASPVTRARTPGGNPIDTTTLNADIAQAEKNLNGGPGDNTSRTALAHAYLARASALTKARQYSSALGDYRRTLKYDPENKEAQEMSTMIINIFKSMGRDAPAEGKEPQPLPAGDNNQETDANKQKAY